VPHTIYPYSLGPEGPLLKQLNQLNKNLNGSDSATNNDSNNVEQLKEITTHLGQIKSIIATDRTSKNHNDNEQILSSIHSINEKIDTISKYFTETYFNKLQESQIANIKVAQIFDELKTTLTNEVFAQPSKRGLFGRMINR
jgi:hypothetical protein